MSKKLVESYLKTELNCEDFSGNMYYVKLNSLNTKDLCIVEIDNHFFVLGYDCSGAYGAYTDLIKEYMDNKVDLFFIRNHISYGWQMDCYLSTLILQKIFEELKN
jgi:hypothetical protein